MENILYRMMDYLSEIPETALSPLLFGLALLQYIFPPAPSDTLLVGLGILVGNNVFNAFFGFLSYSVGAIIGALALFEVCFRLGDRVRKIKIISKVIDEKKLEKSKRNIEKYGGISYFFLRFVPSMQCVTIVVMGLLRINKGKARFYIMTVTFLACSAYYLLGVFLGSNLPRLSSVLSAMGAAGWVLLAAIIVVIAAFIVIYYFINKNKK